MACIMIGPPFAVKSHQVQHRHLQIIDISEVFNSTIADAIGFSIGHSATDGVTGQSDDIAEALSGTARVIDGTG